MLLYANPILERRREQEQLRLLYALQDLRADGGAVRREAVDKRLLGRPAPHEPIQHVAVAVMYEMPKRRFASEN